MSNRRRSKGSGHLIWVAPQPTRTPETVQVTVQVVVVLDSRSNSSTFAESFVSETAKLLAQTVVGIASFYLIFIFITH